MMRAQMRLRDASRLRLCGSPILHCRQQNGPQVASLGHARLSSVAASVSPSSPPISHSSTTKRGSGGIPSRINEVAKKKVFAPEWKIKDTFPPLSLETRSLQRDQQVLERTGKNFRTFSKFIRKEQKKEAWQDREVAQGRDPAEVGVDTTITSPDHIKMTFTSEAIAPTLSVYSRGSLMDFKYDTLKALPLEAQVELIRLAVTRNSPRSVLHVLQCMAMNQSSSRGQKELLASSSSGGSGGGGWGNARTKGNTGGGSGSGSGGAYTSNGLLSPELSQDVLRCMQMSTNARDLRTLRWLFQAPDYDYDILAAIAPDASDFDNPPGSASASAKKTQGKTAATERPGTSSANLANVARKSSQSGAAAAASSLHKMPLSLSSHDVDKCVAFCLQCGDINEALKWALTTEECMGLPMSEVTASLLLPALLDDAAVVGSDVGQKPSADTLFYLLSEMRRANIPVSLRGYEMLLRYCSRHPEQRWKYSKQFLLEMLNTHYSVGGSLPLSPSPSPPHARSVGNASNSSNHLNNAANRAESFAVGVGGAEAVRSIASTLNTLLSAGKYGDARNVWGWLCNPPPTAATTAAAAAASSAQTPASVDRAYALIQALPRPTLGELAVSAATHGHEAMLSQLLGAFAPLPSAASASAHGRSTLFDQLQAMTALSDDAAAAAAVAAAGPLSPSSSPYSGAAAAAAPPTVLGASLGYLLLQGGSGGLQPAGRAAGDAQLGYFAEQWLPLYERVVSHAINSTSSASSTSSSSSSGAGESNAVEAPKSPLPPQSSRRYEADILESVVRVVVSSACAPLEHSGAGSSSRGMKAHASALPFLATFMRHTLAHVSAPAAAAAPASPAPADAANAEGSASQRPSNAPAQTASANPAEEEASPGGVGVGVGVGGGGGGGVSLDLDLLLSPSLANNLISLFAHTGEAAALAQRSTSSQGVALTLLFCEAQGLRLSQASFALASQILMRAGDADIVLELSQKYLSSSEWSGDKPSEARGSGSGGVGAGAGADTTSSSSSSSESALSPLVYSSALEALAITGDFDVLVTFLLREIPSRGQWPSNMMFVMSMNALCRVGRFAEAVKLFDLATSHRHATPRGSSSSSSSSSSSAARTHIRHARDYKLNNALVAGALYACALGGLGQDAIRILSMCETHGRSTPVAPAVASRIFDTECAIRALAKPETIEFLPPFMNLVRGSGGGNSPPVGITPRLQLLCVAAALQARNPVVAEHFTRLGNDDFGKGLPPATPVQGQGQSKGNHSGGAVDVDVGRILEQATALMHEIWPEASPPGEGQGQGQGQGREQEQGAEQAQAQEQAESEGQGRASDGKVKGKDKERSFNNRRGSPRQKQK